MTEPDRDNQIERLLQRYRPAGPPDDLRSRVLSAARVRPTRRPGHSTRVLAFAAAVAAVIVLAIGLRAITFVCMAACILASPGKGY